MFNPWYRIRSSTDEDPGITDYLGHGASLSMIDYAVMVIV